MKRWSMGKKSVRRLAAAVCLMLFLAGPGNVWAEEAEPPAEGDLHAKAAVLIDGDSGRVLYSKDGQEVLPMASTTKIMTCILALEHADLEEEVTASSNAAAQPKVHLGMHSGQVFRMEDLLYALMLESFNDTAVAIAEHVGGSVEGFAALMNQKAEALGAEHTHFVTPNGLDAPGHETTAEDLARIMRYCIMESPKREEFLKITRTASYSFTDMKGTSQYSCQNHNALLTSMEGAVSGKTGFTGTAGYCYIGAVERDGRTLIAALLACGWPPNKSWKWSDMRKLAEYGFAAYDHKETLQLPELPVLEVEEGIPDSGGLWGKSTVKLSASLPENAEWLLKKGEQITCQMECRDKLEAPVGQGQRVGVIRWSAGGEILEETEIFTAEAADRREFSWSLGQLLKLFLP
ncbi:D-alanyl-D-alanine carboxypeptidase family protein [Cuneatibacter caecimuris]|uniref:serine-type D-Ala-D-Ala carboxypeptidase n=1 Tax=Cuneatibacter caecimuris TaxID=1796618 RepID=A0A4V2F7U2_9FIRM|nr:D-alanyl-D-alanine carboxypeptidase family protein [Cuneatibacter caecimuris]RZT01019.1 D-alanyl-D-alanine carboxypeptidase (penicillin-binding protein 5/6) [Cuneatibacter caecimuris]